MICKSIKKTSPEKLLYYIVYYILHYKKTIKHTYIPIVHHTTENLNVLDVSYITTTPLSSPDHPPFPPPISRHTYVLIPSLLDNAPN